MNYQKIHDTIIVRAQIRNKISGSYYERHHIIPKACGGSNKKDNLVFLTAKEHYLVHWLLYKINPIPKLAYAWRRMCSRGSKYHAGRTTSRYYEASRKAFVKAHSETMTGRKLSDEHRTKISKSKMGEKNPMFGKKHTEEHKQYLSEMNVGEKNGFYGKTHSDDFKSKLSEYAKARVGEASNAFGYEHTPETKEYLSSLHKGKPRAKPHEIVLCPHCGKEGIKPNMTRWHFDNCKNRTTIVLNHSAVGYPSAVRLSDNEETTFCR